MALYSINNRVSNLEYPIRDVLLPAQTLEKKGIKIIKLNIGDPAKFGFVPQNILKKALYDAIENGFNYYSDSEGLADLRQAIALRELTEKGVDLDPNRIILTAGVSEAINFIFATIVSKNSEVLVPGPAYPPYIAYTKFYGGIPVPYKTIEEKNWQPDIEDISEKISEKTVALVVINPNNPTGSVYSENILKKIYELCEENKLILITDEIYDKLVFKKKYFSIASFKSQIPIILLNGFSKSFFVTGWRVGYMGFKGESELTTQLYENCMRLARIRLCVGTPQQKAFISGLKLPADFLKTELEKLKARRDFAYKRLNEIEGISTTKPMGAFYIFPKIESDIDDKKFVLDVLNNCYLLFVHGSGFCPIYGRQHFRSVFLPPISILSEAFDRLEKYMVSLK
jgi:aspartate/methionine/tyrosine aminotransferase